MERRFHELAQRLGASPEDLEAVEKMCQTQTRTYQPEKFNNSKYE